MYKPVIFAIAFKSDFYDMFVLLLSTFFSLKHKCHRIVNILALNVCIKNEKVNIFEYGSGVATTV